MQIKLQKSYNDAEIGAIVDCDDQTANELIQKGIAILDNTDITQIEAEIKEIVNKEINIKVNKEIKMETKDMEFGLGKYFMNVAKKAITGNSETGSAADGGATVYTGLGEIENLIMAESQVFGKCRKITLAKNANAMKIPVSDSDFVVKATVPVATNPAEGSYGTVSKVAFDARTLTLTKTSIVVPVTSELLEDASAMDSYVRMALVGKLANVKDYEILKGGGGGYTAVNGDTNYCITTSLTATPTIAELQTMVGKVHPQLQAGSEWFMSQTDWAIIVGAHSTEKNVAMQNINASAMMLLGKKVNIIPSLAANDIFFGNLSQYVVIEAPLGDRLQVSEHVNFANDEIVFKITSRGAGALVAKKRATGDSLSIAAFSEKA
jgi:HK97 family phage major capsid protein